MAVFDPKEKFQPADLKYVSSYELPALDMKSIGDFSELMFKAQEDKLKNIEKNFGSIMDTQDSLLGMRFDNARQAEVLKQARERYSLTENTFASLNVNDLQNSIYSRTLSGRFKQISNDPAVIDVAKEVMAADAFRSKIPSIKDPVLRARAMEQYRRYRETGDINGLDLNADIYDSVDLDKEMANAVDLVKATKTEDWEVDPTNTFMGVRSTTEKNSDAIDETIASLVRSNPKVAENMKARGYMDEDGNMTPAFLEHKKKLLAGIAARSSELENIHVLPEAQAKAKAEGKELLGGGDGDYSPGRFSNKTKDGRNANSIDKGLRSRGFELLDESTTTAIANRGGGIIETYLPGNEKNVPPGDYLVVKNAEGGVIYKIKLTRMSPEKAMKGRNSFVIAPNGPADDIIRQVIAHKESSGRYDVFVPSKSTGTAGKNQLLISAHRPEIKQALAEMGIDWTTIKPSAKINNINGTMKMEDRQLAQAFIKSPEAQDRAMDLWYDQLKEMLARLQDMHFSPDDAVQNLSQTELMYILHHEGTVEAAINYIRTGKSDHDRLNPRSTAELDSSIETIRNSLELAGLSGEIKDDGTMMPRAFVAGANAAIGGPNTIPIDTAGNTVPESPNLFRDID